MDLDIVISQHPYSEFKRAGDITAPLCSSGQLSPKDLAVRPPIAGAVVHEMFPACTSTNLPLAEPAVARRTCRTGAGMAPVARGFAAAERSAGPLAVTVGALLSCPASPVAATTATAATALMAAATATAAVAAVAAAAGRPRAIPAIGKRHR